MSIKSSCNRNYPAVPLVCLLVALTVQTAFGQTANKTCSTNSTTNTSCTTSRSSDFNPDELCPLIPYGTKIKDPRFCNVYISCMNDTSVTGSCGEQFFDRDTGECVDPTTINCLSSDPCAKKPTGFVADPYSCSNYYYCANGVGTLGKCSTGLNYNPDTNNCVRNFSCEITMLPEDYCNIVPEGVFIKVPDSCTEYQLCWQSKLLNGTCPDGFYFDAYRGGCDYPNHVECSHHKDQLPNIPEDVKCTESGVFISDGVTCDGYFYCSELADGTFDMRYGRCPADRFFEPTDGGQCAPRTSVKCEHNRCVTMGMDFIQMANVNGDGCVGFSLCQNGQTIGQAQCPQGQYFDEWSQLCVDQVIDYVACSKGEGDDAAVPSTTTTEVISKAAAEFFSYPNVVLQKAGLAAQILSPVVVPRFT
ncbi:peritrophin-44-like [Musca vetustissima]|uniref:peritrophin-44-like n=1 Tax=Musca vetustissima TaxID=27455 RepID=UPI002AB7748D|nr:peritrophin-44-like [Musca vetustissima]